MNWKNLFRSDWLRQLRLRWFGRTAHSPIRRDAANPKSWQQRLRRLLGLEQLEAREMMSAVAWDGQGDGVSWHDPLNWSTNTVPGSADDVLIDDLGNTQVVLTGNMGTVRTVCRVIRLEPASTHPVLVAATDWFGRTAPDLTEKRLKKPLDLTYVGGSGGYRSWVVADVPPHFSKLGTVLPSAADKRADSPFHSSWNVFLRTIVSQLKWTQRAHETDGNEPPTSDK
jgi:hypothetical protein